MFYILENRLNNLPLEILEKIFKLVLASSAYEWPNHMVNNCDSLAAVDSFYKIVLRKIGYHYLPRIYISYRNCICTTDRLVYLDHLAVL